MCALSTVRVQYLLSTLYEYVFTRVVIVCAVHVHGHVSVRWPLIGGTALYMYMYMMDREKIVGLCGFTQWNPNKSKDTVSIIGLSFQGATCTYMYVHVHVCTEC